MELTIHRASREPSYSNWRRRRLGHDALGDARRVECAVSIYFPDTTLVSAFVARWCVGAKAETAGGVFQVREDEPEARVGVGLHRTP